MLSAGTPVREKVAVDSEAFSVGVAVTDASGDSEGDSEFAVVD